MFWDGTLMKYEYMYTTRNQCERLSAVADDP